MVTASNSSSPNGSFLASACDELDVRVPPAALLDHARREVGGDDAWRRFRRGRRTEVPVPAATSRMRSPGSGSTARRSPSARASRCRPRARRWCGRSGGDIRRTWQRPGRAACPGRPYSLVPVLPRQLRPHPGSDARLAGVTEPSASTSAALSVADHARSTTSRSLFRSSTPAARCCGSAAARASPDRRGAAARVHAARTACGGGRRLATRSPRAATVDRSGRPPGTGLVAFGTFAFADDERRAERAHRAASRHRPPRRRARWITRIVDGSTMPVTRRAHRSAPSTGFAAPRARSHADGYRASASPTPSTRIRAGAPEQGRARPRPRRPPARRAPTCAACSSTSRSATPTAGPSRSTASSARARRRSCASTTAPSAARVLAGTISRGADARLPTTRPRRPRHLDERPRRAPLRRRRACSPRSARTRAARRERACRSRSSCRTSGTSRRDVAGTLSDGSTSLDLIARCTRPPPSPAPRPTAPLGAHPRARAVRPRPLRRAGRLGRRRRRRRVGDRAALRPGRRRRRPHGLCRCGIVARLGPRARARRDEDEVPPDRRGLRLIDEYALRRRRSTVAPARRSRRAAPSRPRRRSRLRPLAGRAARARRAAGAARRAARTTCGSAGTTNQGASVGRRPRRTRSGTPPGSVPELALVDVARVVLPVLVRAVEPRGEPLLLLVGRDVQHHLDDGGAVCDELVLEVVDAAVALLDLLGASSIARTRWISTSS